MLTPSSNQVKQYQTSVSTFRRPFFTSQFVHLHTDVVARTHTHTHSRTLSAHLKCIPHRHTQNIIHTNTELHNGQLLFFGCCFSYSFCILCWPRTERATEQKKKNVFPFIWNKCYKCFEYVYSCAINRKMPSTDSVHINQIVFGLGRKKKHTHTTSQSHILNICHFLRTTFGSSTSSQSKLNGHTHTREEKN